MRLTKIFLASVFLIFASNSLASTHGGGEGEEKKIVLDKTDSIFSMLRADPLPHIGGIAAINLLLCEIPDVEQEFKDRNLLDYGTNKGGNAYFLMNRGFISLWGCDSNEENITQAKNDYPAINFKLATIQNLTDIFDESFFSLVLMINSAKNEQEKALLWQKTKNITKKDGMLAILDYSLLDTSNPKILTTADGKPLYPIEVESTTKFLKFIGWEIIQVRDISPDFLNWHKEMLESIESRRDLLEKAGILPDEIDLVVTYLHNLITLIDEEKIGGTIIVVKKT